MSSDVTVATEGMHTRVKKRDVTLRGLGSRELRAACAGQNPYVATTILHYVSSPSIVAVRDTDLGEWPRGGVNPSLLPLARIEDTGQLYGLAFDPIRGHLYSARTHLDHNTYAHTDLGALFRTDVETGMTDLVRSLPAGSAPLPAGRGAQDFSLGFVHTIGRTGLGDIDIDGDARWLFVANLYDGNVYRLDLPDLAVSSVMRLATQKIGGADEILPFGLGLWGDLLYCGAIVLGPSVPRVALFVGPTSGDLLDLTLLEELNYERQPLWQSWTNETYHWNIARNARVPFAEPIVSDIEFSATGVPIVGLANRRFWIRDYTEGSGSALPTRRDALGNLHLVQDGDFYEDHVDIPGRGTRSDFLGGALARLPIGNLIVASTWYSDSGAVRWLRNDDGRIQGPQDGTEGVIGDAFGIGDIEVLCAPVLSTPTETPTPTDSPSTATPLTSATPPPSPTTTRTPRPTPIYLPLAQRSHCVQVPRLLEVSLVVDLSTSMLRPSEGGGRKVDGVVEAVEAFVVEMLGDGAGSGAGGAPPDAAAARVGLVGFHHETVELAPLSADGAALQAVAAGLPGRLAEGTRLDLALRAGARQVAEQGRPGAQRVLILITDGLPNQVPTPAPAGSQEDAVLREAQSARDAGVLLVTVGLGRPEAPDPLDRINAQLLAAIAGDPARYHQTPDARRLAAIYRQIAVSLRGCL